MTTVCLTSIVKNEGKIIERMLESVLSFVDFVNLCDTGSEDDTVEKAENFLKSKNIPFKINYHEWKDFGHNRTLSIKSAQKNFPQSDYLFFMDADMKLEIDNNFTKNDLKAHGYRIIQYNDTQNYYNLRFAKTSHNWICVGRTHEYYKCDGCEEESLSLNTIRINDIGDGGCKSDKFERDKRLLIEDYKENPTNPRTLFYLAQTYQCLNEFDKSLEFYQKRIDAKDWFEEVYISYLRLGEIYTKMGKYQMALASYLQGYDYRPIRAECLFEACKLAKENKNFHLAFLLASQGIKIKYPDKDVLFINRIAHSWGFHFELSISSFYSGHHEIGLASCYKVLTEPSVPPQLKELTIKNMRHYYGSKGIDIKDFARLLTQDS